MRTKQNKTLSSTNFSAYRVYRALVGSMQTYQEMQARVERHYHY